jgi:hypothetical protein
MGRSNTYVKGPLLGPHKGVQIWTIVILCWLRSQTLDAVQLNCIRDCALHFVEVLYCTVRRAYRLVDTHQRQKPESFLPRVLLCGSRTLLQQPSSLTVRYGYCRLPSSHNFSYGGVFCHHLQQIYREVLRTVLLSTCSPRPIHPKIGLTTTTVTSGCASRPNHTTRVGTGTLAQITVDRQIQKVGRQSTHYQKSKERKGKERKEDDDPIKSYDDGDDDVVRRPPCPCWQSRR